MLFFCCKKKQKLQRSGLMSKHSNLIVIVFIVWRQFFFLLFCFCETNFDVFRHLLWASWLKRKCTFHGNIYTNEKFNPFSNKICNLYVKKKKKKIYLTDYKRSYFSNFPLVLSANMHKLHLYNPIRGWTKFFF